VTTGPASGRDQWRPAFHLTPERGWINDPNGLIHWRGRWHCFSQHNPAGTVWAPMHWGHADSTDLLAWTHRPVALAPGEPYDKEGGCWSGSAAVDGETLHLLYTGASGEKCSRQSVCLASSPDGIVFTKDPANPVIPGPPPGGTNDFRDPRVFRWHDRWRAVIGASRGGRGCVLLYESGDLRCWRRLGVLAESDGTLGHMWECPDIFPLGEKWILVVSPMGVPGVGSLALVGTMEEDGTRFAMKSRHLLDFGPDFYAPQTMAGPDGRRILIGWMDHWQSPEPPTVAAGWRGAMTLPRELALLPGGAGISISPVRELAGRRGEELGLPARALLADLEAELEVAPSATGTWTVTVRGSAEGARGTLLVYDAATDEVMVDPTRSGRAARGSRRMPALRADGRVRIRAVLDACSLEVFAGDPPRNAMSCLVFPEPGDEALMAGPPGPGLRVVRLSVQPLRPSAPGAGG